jgi:predicted GNAT family acetyltransferase
MNGIIEITEGYVDWSEESDCVSIDEDGVEVYEDYIRINNLFVKDEFRGQGFARKLMDSAIEIIKKQSSLTIKILPEPNEDGVDFYRLAEFYSEFDVEVVAV